MERERIVISPYDPAWPRWFESERALLERVLTPWLEGGIHHIGSTSIPGVAAKPIVDMIAGVSPRTSFRTETIASKSAVRVPSQPRPVTFTHRS